MVTKILLAAILFVLSLSNYAKAAEIKDYDAMKSNKIVIVETSPRRSLTLHLVGVFKGLRAANAALMKEGKPMLFCKDEKIPLNEDNLIQIIDNQLEQLKDFKGELPVEWVLFLGLQSTFPCNK